MPDAFINYLLSRVGNSLYVWGAQGESIKSIVREWAEKRETSDKNVERVMALLDKFLEEDLYFYDCSGLGVSWLLEHGLIKSDMTAQGMYNLCTTITRDQLQKGDWVFIKSSSGKITHIGYMVSNDLDVVESKGRDNGVVKRKLSQGAWNAYGRPESLFPGILQCEKGISRVLKLTSPYMQGEDVKILQKAIGVEQDGVFGPNTEASVKSKQQKLGLVVDGKAGKNTITALGLKWLGNY